MPLYEFVCPKCKKTSRRIMTRENFKAGKDLKCKQTFCDGVLRRHAQPPTSHNKEVIRQSHQPKDIERFTDVEKLMDERSKKDHRKPE